MTTAARTEAAAKAECTQDGYRYTSTLALRARRLRIQAKAHRIMKAALAEGRIPPASTQACEDCGKAADSWHHADYRLPMTLKAVCDRCHMKQPMGLPWAPPVVKQDGPFAERVRPLVVWLSRADLNELRPKAKYERQSLERFVARAAIVHARFGDPADMVREIEDLRDALANARTAGAVTPKIRDAVRALHAALCATDVDDEENVA